MQTLEQILHFKIVAIIRGISDKDITNVAMALFEGGVRVLEITLNSPGALKSIATLSALPDSPLLVGAGTVLSASDARAAMDAGAKFIISPMVSEEVIRVTKQAGMVSLPGALTPTEIYTAHIHGADIIKVFPAPSPSYISNMLAPLNHLRLMPTGGVTAANIREFLDAGSVAAGIGSSLVRPTDRIDKAYLSDVTVRAKKFLEALSAV